VSVTRLSTQAGCQSGWRWSILDGAARFPVRWCVRTSHDRRTARGRGEAYKTQSPHGPIGRDRSTRFRFPMEVARSILFLSA
jgi:hypothetical protein